MRSKEDAVEWTNRFMKVNRDTWPGREGEADILQMFGAEDFPGPGNAAAATE